MKKTLFALISAILTLASAAQADVGAELAPKLLGTWYGESGDCNVSVAFVPTATANVVGFSYALSGCGTIMESLDIPAFELVPFEDRDHREIFAFRNVRTTGFADAHVSGRYLAAGIDAAGDLAFNFGGWAAFGDSYSIDARVVYLTRQAP